MYPFLPPIFGFEIPLYGIMTALGYACAIWYCIHNRQSVNMAKENIWDISFAIVVGALIGGKIFFIIFNWDSFITLNLFDKLRYGFVFYGGFIGAALAAIYYTRKFKVPFFKFADFVVPAIALGHSLGRIGCGLAGCCYGKISHSFLAVHYHNPQCLVPEHLHNLPLYPTQFMEAGANFVLFLSLAYLYKRPHKTGTVTAAYVIGYGIIRFCLEFLRGDDRGAFILGLSPSQFIGAALVLAAAFYLIKRK